MRVMIYPGNHFKPAMYLNKNQAMIKILNNSSLLRLKIKADINRIKSDLIMMI